MKEQKTEHSLIEHILTLLNILEKSNMDIRQVMEKSEYTELYFLMNSQNIQTAYEVIKFMDEMPGGFLIYRADDDENIIYANKALLHIFQCDTLKEFQKLTGNSFKGIVHPDDIDEVEQSIWEQIASSQYDLDYVEYRIIRKDGEIRWIEDYGHFIQSESIGNIFYVFLSDATEKMNRQQKEKTILLNEKKQKEELQNLIEKYDKERKLINQEHLRRLEVIEGLSVNYESILYVDLDTDEIMPYRMSDRTESQFGKKFQTLSFIWYISDYVNTWVHPEDKNIVSMATSPKYIIEKLSTVKTYYINYRVLNKGETQYLHLQIVNVGNKEHISQIVMGYRRVDEEIRREMEQNQMLEEALSKANLAIVAKDTFLSNMSHDMRTPLNAIFGFTELAKKHVDDSAVLQHYLDKVEESGRNLLQLIDKVLEISWTETKDANITETECNIHDIVQNIYKIISPQAAEKNISISLSFKNMEHYDVYNDQDKLKKLLLYLTDNAVTYTEVGGKIDIIVTEQEKLSNDYVVYQFVVKDTGIGMGEDFLEHIFEPFEREKNTTFSGIYGTGLGLTIVKNIVNMMGGDIEVKSSIGKGSTFIITLRMRIQNHPPTCASNDNDIIVQLQNQKILLVEDNEINMEIETEILQGLGFIIDTATDGSIAVEKVKNSKPGDYALILMDIQMPVMDGRQATKNIRNLDIPKLARIPIIALSANAFESDKQMSIESGMDAHLSKPIDISLLLETMVKTIQTHKILYENEIQSS